MFSSRTTTFTELTYRAKGNEEQQAACIMQLSNKKTSLTPSSIITPI